MKGPGCTPHPPLEFDEHGAPFSGLFRDVFRSREGALAESLEVFVKGVRLAERSQGRSSFTVLEIGFGLGINFLATLETWRTCSNPKASLHYVAIEKHPLPRDQLALAHRAMGIHTERADQLREQWPPATPDLHKLVFDQGRATLWLAFGDAQAWVRQLRCGVDAVYLDGFSPALNPECWSPGLIKGLARLCRREARLSTYSAARPVRDALQRSGFIVERTQGFGRKRNRIDALYRPTWPSWPEPAAPPQWSRQHALVVGAGLAGTAVAARLNDLGWTITLIDQASGLMRGGSAQPLVADHLHVSADDNLMARASRAALFFARAARIPLGVSWERSPLGRLQLGTDEDETQWLQHTARALGFPYEVLAWVDAEEASGIAGTALPSGGLWMPTCDVLDPQRLGLARCERFSEATTLLLHCRVSALERRDDDWCALGSDGTELARAPVVILCSPDDLTHLAGLRSLALRRIRGQTSWIDPNPLPGLRCVLGGPAYAVPWTQRLLIGASYEESDTVGPDRSSDLSNLARFRRLLGPHVTVPEAALSSAQAGFRWTTADRMPLIGALPDEVTGVRLAESLLRNAKLELPRQQGLFCATALGSRGSLWSELSAELIGALLTGSPCPVPADIAAALDPGRHLRRHLQQRGTIH